MISRTEELLLLTVWRLKEDAYGMTVLTEFSELVGKDMSVGAVYIPLKRLIKRGYLSYWDGEPTEKRGGKAKRFYKLTPEGVQALQTVKSIHEKAWFKLPELNIKPAK